MRRDSFRCDLAALQTASAWPRRPARLAAPVADAEPADAVRQCGGRRSMAGRTSAPTVTAIRPPELAPRLDYAALLLVADRVVLADTFALSRQSGHSRMRIRTSQGSQWLTVPRRHTGASPPLHRVAVLDDGWRRRHRAAIRSAYGMAPFYDHVAPEWAEILATPGSLADLTAASVRWAARWLGASAEIVRASDLAGAPAALADVAQAVGVETLLTLPESSRRDAETLPGVTVRVLDYAETERRQAFPGFAPGLSVLDVVMNHGPASGDLVRAGIASVIDADVLPGRPV